MTLHDIGGSARYTGAQLTSNHPIGVRFQALHRKDAPLQPNLFAPKEPQAGTIRFAVIGDAGSGTKNQLKIAKQMIKTYQDKPFDTVLVLGDNVYDDGEPHLFRERIYEPYRELFDAGVRFFPVMGNHDVRRGFGDQQQAYWGTPPFYNFKIGNDIEFFAIDTTIYLPGYDHCHDEAPELALKKAEIQTQWLEKVLSESQAKYKVVYGHYPIYSSGKHSTDGDKLLKLRRMLEPIFVKHGIDLYLAGHDHHYERSNVIQGIQHFVSGSAGRLREIFYKDNPPYPRAKAIQKFHFMLFELGPQGLSYQVLSKKGKVLDSGRIAAKQQLALLA